MPIFVWRIVFVVIYLSHLIQPRCCQRRFRRWPRPRRWQKMHHRVNSGMSRHCVTCWTARRIRPVPVGTRLLPRIRMILWRCVCITIPVSGVAIASSSHPRLRRCCQPGTRPYRIMAIYWAWWLSGWKSWGFTARQSAMAARRPRRTRMIYGRCMRWHMLWKCSSGQKMALAGWITRLIIFVISTRFVAIFGGIRGCF